MNKVKIMFPLLHKGVKQSKDNPEGSPYNYIVVRDGHAIVTTPYVVIALNLRDYFLNYHTIDEMEREGFEELMNWMEGKAFTVEFWSYIVAKHDITVLDDDRINVTGDAFQKELIYQEQDVKVENILSLLKNNWINGKTQVSAVGMSANNLKTITDTVGKLIGPNALIFEFNAVVNSTIRFTIEDMPCVFGVMLSSNNALDRPFNFDGFRKFVGN